VSSPSVFVVEGALVYSNLLALLSIGLTITYITTGVPNFAQGSFALFGSYTALTLLYTLKIHPYASVPLAFALGGLAGVAVYALALKPLLKREASIVTLMIATLAVDLILLGFFGAYSDFLEGLTGKSAKKFIFTPYDFSIFGFKAILLLSTFAISLLLVSLSALLYGTKFGIALRASMENPELAEVMGVNVARTRTFSWFLSGALASTAGCFLPFRQEIVPLTGSLIIVSIFAASIVGGITSIYGSVLGSYIVGFSESLLTFIISLAFGQILVYSRVISLIMMLIALVIAPKGLAGVVKKKWSIYS